MMPQPFDLTSTFSVAGSLALPVGALDRIPSTWSTWSPCDSCRHTTASFQIELGPAVSFRVCPACLPDTDGMAALAACSEYVVVRGLPC